MVHYTGLAGMMARIQPGSFGSSAKVRQHCEGTAAVRMYGSNVSAIAMATYIIDLAAAAGMSRAAPHRHHSGVNGLRPFSSPTRRSPTT